MHTKDKYNISYHEDFYRMIEFIPSSNYFSSNKYLNDIKSNVSTEDNDFGFKSINVIDEQRKKLIDEKILLSNVEDILNSYLENSTTLVSKGYSESFSKQENIKAWGLEYSVIFVEYVNQFVQSIWLLETGGPFVIQSDRAEKLREVIFTIGSKLDLILVDWNKDLIINASNYSKVTDYLTDILKYQL